MQRISNILVIVCGIAMGGTLLTLSVPRIMAAFNLLSVEIIKQNANAGNDVSIEQLIHLREAQKASLDWKWSSESNASLARTEIILGNTTKNTHDRSLWHEQAMLTVEDGLLKAPSNPYSWARLANLRLLAGDDGLGVSEPLIMSILTGPYERNLVLIRLKYALRIWNRLSEDQIVLIRDQILIADRVNRSRLVNMALAHNKNLKIIVSAMTGDLSRFQGFIKALNK